MSPAVRRVPPPLMTWTSSTPRPTALARAALRQALDQLWVPEGVIDDAVLAVSELVANASQHATGPYELRFRESDTEIICEVLDGDPRIPRISHRLVAEPFAPKPEHRGGGVVALRAALAERGRGLLIIDCLTNGCWGFRAEPPVGKIAWMAIPYQAGKLSGGGSR